MDLKNNIVLLGLVILDLLFAPLFSTSAFAANKPIGTLTEFSGHVIIRSQGSWEVEPTVGFPLYSDDKVITRIGSAVIQFEDGAVVEIKKNSNLNIIEKEEEKGFLQKVMEKKRSLRLMVGKLLFKSGKSGIQTKLETSTMVCGLRGTAGTLSIGADGQTYIQFTEGGSAFTIGEFISGVAEDVPQELADLNPAQRAAFVAKAAADQAKRAAESVATGEASDADLALAKANAAKAAAEEIQTITNIIIQNSSDEEMIEEAQGIAAEAEKAIAEAGQAIQDAIDAGAVPTEPAEPYEEPDEGPGFDVPVTTEPDLDSGAASPI